MTAKREARAPGNRRGSDRRGEGDRTAASNRHTAADSASRRSRAGKTTAPHREARMPKSGPQTSPMPRPVDRPARPKNTSQAKARAKARKAKSPKVVRPKLSERLAVRLASIDLRPQTLLSKVPFVVLVIGSLGVGLALTLWLSTDAAERSYQLSHARERTRILQQQKEALERDVREAGSAPALAEAARKQGMIPTRDTAHLVQAPDGNWVVVGTPKPADGVPPPPLNTKLPEEGPPQPPKPPVVPRRFRFGSCRAPVTRHRLPGPARSCCLALPTARRRWVPTATTCRARRRRCRDRLRCRDRRRACRDSSRRSFNCRHPSARRPLRRCSCPVKCRPRYQSRYRYHCNRAPRRRCSAYRRLLLPP
ncbi:putative conserved proline rich membrane protein [Mycobacterium kansasii 732]|nr:putative conserved proline rich membrane protein [Mycobacterium kansasii 732]